MARSVEITTPMPTLDEVGDSLGLSKKRRAAIISLFRKDVASEESSKIHRSGSGVYTQKKAPGSVKAAAKR